MSVNASGSKIPAYKLVHNLKALVLKRDGPQVALFSNYHSTVNNIPLPFPHFITCMSKSSSINQSICGMTPPRWKSVRWWLHMERGNVQFHKAWHLQPCHKLQWCQCQEKKLACGSVSSWPQLLTARNCIQNPVLQFTGNSQERSSIYLKLQWAYNPGIIPRWFHTPEFFQAGHQTPQIENSYFLGASM